MCLPGAARIQERELFGCSRRVGRSGIGFGREHLAWLGTSAWFAMCCRSTGGVLCSRLCSTAAFRPAERLTGSNASSCNATCDASFGLEGGGRLYGRCRLGGSPVMVAGAWPASGDWSSHVLEVLARPRFCRGDVTWRYCYDPGRSGWRVSEGPDGAGMELVLCRRSRRRDRQ